MADFSLRDPCPEREPLAQVMQFIEGKDLVIHTAALNSLNIECCIGNMFISSLKEDTHLHNFRTKFLGLPLSSKVYE